jgi:hypothetical protein
MLKSFCRQAPLFAEVSKLPQLCCALMHCFDFDCAVAPRYPHHCAEANHSTVYENHSFSMNKKVIFASCQ